MRTKSMIAVLIAGWFLLPATASAGLDLGIANVEVDGSSLEAEVRLGTFVLADLELEFEDVDDLDVGDLDLGVRLIGLRELDILQRLPGTQVGFFGFLHTVVKVPLQLPLVLSIEPAAGSDLAMSGVWNLELHTHLLEYAPDTRLRLFKSHDGGPFEDITEAMGSGSYRVRASGDCFSEFLIALDLRDVEDVVDLKLDRLEDALDDHAGSISPGVLADLESGISTIRAEWDGGDVLAAILATEDFADAVEAASGTDIPDGWTASSGDDNAAGELRWRAGTLRFSLILAE